MRGYAFGAAPGCPFRLHRHHLLQQHDDDGVVHPLDYGVVDVTYIKLSLVLYRLESHELPIMVVTIFVYHNSSSAVDMTINGVYWYTSK
jgi:hypothetical protein